MDTSYQKIKLTYNQSYAFWILTWDNQYSRIWYGGWAWWWKSFLGVMRLRWMCMRYPWVRYAIARDTIKNAKATTVESLEKFYQLYNIPSRCRWVLNHQNSTINFQNWSKIVLVECAYRPSDPLYNRFGSLELTWAFIEESAECPLEWIELLATRVWRQNTFKKDRNWNIHISKQWDILDDWEEFITMPRKLL